MDTALSTQSQANLLEQVVINGDLSKLSPEQRVSYYKSVCESVGLNPLTKPFDYITLNGKLTLYARKDATDQLRARDNVSITRLDREIINDICLVTAYAETQSRRDASTGAVNIKGLLGDALANAMMKAETKAKRRVTLSICGLGMLDETETETIPSETTYEAAPTRAEASATLANGNSVTYTGVTAKIGKHQYPAAWCKLLAAYSRVNQFEVDGILQKLALKQDTKPEDVIGEIDLYLDEKDSKKERQDEILNELGYETKP